MTSTWTFQGLKEGSRNSSKVLKPPGGGSSNIFGSASEETSPRRTNNHNQSQLGSAIFGEDSPNSNNPEATRVNKPGNDSYNRLFGPPSAPPTPNSKNHMRSNISLSNESTATSSFAKSNNSSGVTGKASIFVNGNGGHFNGYSASGRSKRFRGNPITGTGYSGDDAQNSETPVQTRNANENGVEKSNATSIIGIPAVQGRNRVPPGGYSSGLW